MLVAVFSSTLIFLHSSLHSFAATFFIFFHLSFLPSGSLDWCDAGCQSQGYMWCRVGGGGPWVWALWQRQQVQQFAWCLPLPIDVSPRYFTLFPKIHFSLYTAPPSHFPPSLTWNGNQLKIVFSRVSKINCVCLYMEWKNRSRFNF